MKKSSVLFLSGILLFGTAMPVLAQDVLPEVTVTAVRYKYLRAVDSKDLAQPVKLLEKMAAEYDVRKSDYYEDEYDTYFISFYIPEGEVLAVYDQNGKLLRTAEKFRSIALPKVVAEAVARRFPGWTIADDVYLVNYKEDRNVKKVYKIVLENGDKRLKVKTNDLGDFL